MSKTYYQKGFMSVLLVVLAIVIIAVVTGGYYLYIKQYKTATLPKSATSSQLSPAAVNTVVNTPHEFESDLNSVQLDSIDSDFSEMDQDINNL